MRGLKGLSQYEACVEYARMALDMDMPLSNIKYALVQMVAAIQPKPDKRKIVRRILPKKKGGKAYDCELTLSVADCIKQAKTKEEIGSVFDVSSKEPK